MSEPADDLLREFIAESREHLDQFDRDIVALEADPANAGALGRMFRAIHTIKGTCGFLGLPRLEAVTHVGEGLLSALRDGRRTADSRIASGLLALGDAVRGILAEIDRTGGEGPADNGALARRLRELARGGEPAPAPAGSAGGGAGPGAAEDTVRVGIGLLDTLMRLADELVLLRNRIETLTADPVAPPLRTAVQHLDLITDQLQAEMMQLRMQPLAVLWSKFPRQVRDMAAACGKQVVIELAGEEIELDRAIMEQIRDPLVHLVRNAVDHGIEAPARRASAGKPPAGRLTLHARYEGGQVRIEITDDGAGLDLEAVRRKAVECGLAAADEAARLGPAELAAFVFSPGFSTSERVTSLSGRGVGMDVVKTNVERAGGSVGLRSVPGAGTTVEIALPLTLAILPALVVEAAGGRYVVPQLNVVELIRLGSPDGPDVEWAHAAPVARVRGDLLPLASLADLLAGGDGAERFREAERPPLVAVVQAGPRRFGLAMDAVVDTQDIVVKPRSAFLGAGTPFAGTTVTGDGRVALILDVVELARRARVLGGGETAGPAPAQRAPAAPAPEPARLLLFRSPDAGRMVMPLERVIRVERVPRGAVERAGKLDVINHGGTVLPLIHVAAAVRDRRAGARAAEPSSADALHVVVLANGERRVGLVVDRVLDIVAEPLVIDRPAGRAGVLGTAVVRSRVTEVFDADGAIRRRDPGFFAAAVARA